MNKKRMKSLKCALLGMTSLAVMGGWQTDLTAEAAKTPETPFKGITIMERPFSETKRYQIPTYWNQRERKVVYLTFDDGPSYRTEDLLDVLEEYDVPATFFFVGTQIEGKEDIVEMVADAGHYVAMHSISHSVDTLYNEETPDNLTNELIEMQDMIEEITGHRPILFRAPYGTMPHMKKEPILESLYEAGFKAWDWTVDSYDWSVNSVSALMEMVKKTSGSRQDVVLMHEKALTVEALPSVIEYYKSEGYEFRAYDENNHVVVNQMKDDRF